uniref:Uncharacterized protein n=1 Tax=Romanomermis culicivorax TaxID=13658 RepID=A0A915IG20_ROMCU
QDILLCDVTSSIEFSIAENSPHKKSRGQKEFGMLENESSQHRNKFRISRTYETESRRILMIDEKSYLTRLECDMMLESGAKFSFNLLRLNASTTITLYRPHNDTLDKLNCSVIKPPIQEKFDIKLQWISPGFQLGPIVSTPYVEVYAGAPGVYSCRCAISYVGDSKKFIVFHDQTIDISATREGGLINNGRAIYMLIAVAVILLLIPIVVICQKIRKEKRQRSRMRKRSRCRLHKHYPMKSKSNSTTVTASDASKTGKKRTIVAHNYKLRSFANESLSEM